MVLSTWRTQEARLPKPRAGMRQQLDAWARQAAAVRAGGVSLDCELGGLQDFELMRLSPHADQVAACRHDNQDTAALAPVTSSLLDLASLLAAQPPGCTLAHPSPGHGVMEDLRWCPTSQRVVLVSHEDIEGSSALRVSTFKDSQLVGSYLEPLAALECFHSLHVSDAAAALLLIDDLDSHAMVRVVASTAQGIVTARHPVAHPAGIGPLEGSRILVASSACDRLFVFTASSAQEVSLQRAPQDSMGVLVSSWGQMALQWGKCSPCSWST